MTKLGPILNSPKRRNYDVVIVGGAIIGSSVAWFLSDNPDFDGSVLVVEKDASYEFCSTAHSNSCIRQQFSGALNVRISQFGAEFIKNFRTFTGGDARVPEVTFQRFGYMYLADTERAAGQLRENQKVQAACGAGTRIMTPEEIAKAYPFYALDDIVLGSHNLVDEGYFDATTLFDWWRRIARERGVEYVAGEVVAMTQNGSGTGIASVTLESGEVIGCGTVVNAAGPRAARVAAMAGITLPVEPRKRYSYIFSAEKPLSGCLPLTVDPSGVHMRTDGAHYLAGCTPDDDPAVEPDDFTEDFSIWEDKAWPALAARVPQFEAIRVINSWVGHYAFNPLDQNAIVGPHDRLRNFLFVNGFSGHGLQQSPAMGRAIAELISHGEFRTLDLSPFSYARIKAGGSLIERAVI